MLHSIMSKYLLVVHVEVKDTCTTLFEKHSIIINFTTLLWMRP